MSGINPVATYQQTNYTVDTATVYKTKIDGNSIAVQRIAGNFVPHQSASPNMTLTLDAGHIFDGTTLTEVAQQVTSTFTAPAGNPRIDRVVIDRLTGAYSVITGTPNASPVAPAVTSGKVPICQVLLQTTSTSITNSMITDERALEALGRGLVGEYASTSLALDAIVTTQNDILVRGASVWGGMSMSTALDTIFGNAEGNILQRGASGWQILAPGSVNTVLASGGASALNAWTALSALLDSVFGSAQGDMLYRGASAWSALTPGTSGQFLETQGASANPLWSALPTATSSSLGLVQPDNTTVTISGGVISASGAMTLISAQTASSVSSLTFSSGINSTYSHYRVEVSNYSCTANPLAFQFYQGGAFTANYYSSIGLSGTTSDNQSNATLGYLGVQNGGSVGNGSGYMEFWQPSLSLNQNWLYNFMTRSGSSTYNWNIGGGTQTFASGAITQIKFVVSSGTFSGTFKLYGIL